MTDKQIRVEFIGLNPGIHWAVTAHIPALKILPDDYKVAGDAIERSAAGSDTK